MSRDSLGILDSAIFTHSGHASKNVFNSSCSLEMAERRSLSGGAGYATRHELPFYGLRAER